MKFTGNFEKMGKIMYRRIFVHHINFYRLENNMKLVSWNVNGIRACITKGFEESFAKLDADIFCLQETKCQENQVKLELPGYYQYWNYANRKGYSGTAVFTKKEPLSVIYGLGIEEHDKEGRVITAEMDDFYLVTVYTPNSQEIDLKNPKTNRMNAGFTDEERACFTRTLEAGFIDTFRYFYPELEGAYSWWSYRFKAREKNAGWRIDYFITSPSLKENLEDAKIHSEIMGSDHCPVELDLKF